MRSVFALAALVAAAGVAHSATITPVVTVNGAGAEPGVGQVYSALTGIALANNAVNAVGAGASGPVAGRVSDSYDQIWFDGTVDVAFSALYWGNTNNPIGSADHSFGVTQNNGPVNNIFDAGPSFGTTLGQVFTGVGPFPTSDALRFVAQNASSGITANSDETLNAGRDRMITFDITGLSTLLVSALGFGGQDIDLTALPPLGHGKGTFLLFFETGSDDDFQDLVVLVHNVRNTPIIPLPSAAGLGFLGLAGLAARRRR